MQIAKYCDHLIGLIQRSPELTLLRLTSWVPDSLLLSIPTALCKAVTIELNLEFGRPRGCFGRAETYVEGHIWMVSWISTLQGLGFSGRSNTYNTFRLIKFYVLIHNMYLEWLATMVEALRVVAAAMYKVGSSVSVPTRCSTKCVSESLLHFFKFFFLLQHFL